MRYRPDSNRPSSVPPTGKPGRRYVFRIIGWLALSFLALLSLMAGLQTKFAPHNVERQVSSYPTADIDAFDPKVKPAPNHPFPWSLTRPLVQKMPTTQLPSANNIPMTIAETNKEAMPAGYLVSQPITKEPKGRILIVRGIFTVFSLGMDELGKKLQELGYQVKVTPSATSYREADLLCTQILQSENKSPLIIIGHSLGGDLAPKLANTFADRDVPVDMLIMLDSTMPSSPPQNVKRCVNLYQSNSSPSWARVFRGTNINAQSQKTEMINVDIRKLAGREQTAGINHFNIDANPWIHDLIVEAVSISHEPVTQATSSTTKTGKRPNTD